MKNNTTILVVILLLACAFPASAELTPIDIKQFFVQPNQSTTLRFDISSDQPYPYTISDFTGKTIFSGQGTSNKQGQLQVELNLAPGYYQLNFSQTKQSFGIDSIAAFQSEPDPFFAIGGGVTSVGTRTTYPHYQTTRRDLIHLFKRCGISLVREGVVWYRVNPEEGTWKPNFRGYGPLELAYAKEGMPVSYFSISPPKYLGRSNGSEFPLDMIKTNASMSHVADLWAKAWGSFEIWNEPYKHGTPAVQYVPLVKSLTYMLRQREDTKNLAVGDGNIYLQYSDYIDMAIQNGLLDNIDFFNIHTYNWATNIQDIVQAYRRALQSSDRPAIPLWITESGRPWPSGTDRPAITDGQTSALDITMKAIESRVCGIQRYFAFIGAFYPEGIYNYGMMDRAASPLRAMAAYAQAIQLLAHHDYLGDLPSTDPSILRARVFGNSHHAVAVLYTGTIAPDKTVKTNLHPLKILGIDGRVLKATANGRIPIPDGLSYVLLDHKPQDLRINTVAMELYNLSQQTDRPQPPSPIVLQVLFDPDSGIRPTTQGYWWNPEPDQKSLSYTVRVNNLSDSPQSLTVQPIYRAQMNPFTQSTKAQQCDVPAKSFHELQWELNLASFNGANGPLLVKIEAHQSNSPTPASSATFRLLPEQSLSQMLKQHAAPTRITINDLSLWNRNASPGAKTYRTIVDSDIWQLTMNFDAAKEKWAFPRLNLPQSLDLSGGYKGIVVRARCEHPANVRLHLQTLKDDQPSTYYTQVTNLIPGDGQWHVRFVPFHQFKNHRPQSGTPGLYADLKQVHQIMAGLGAGKKEKVHNTLQISDLYVVK